MRFNDRFDSLCIDQQKLYIEDSVSQKETEEFFKRYWGLQEDQYCMLTFGLIELEAYTNWMINILKIYEKNPRIGTLSYQDGWKNVGRPEHEEQQPFIAFFDRILTFTPAQKDDVRRVVDNVMTESQSRRSLWFREKKGSIGPTIF